jgi:hypothetical protein
MNRLEWQESLQTAILGVVSLTKLKTNVLSFTKESAAVGSSPSRKIRERPWMVQRTGFQAVALKSLRFLTR